MSNLSRVFSAELDGIDARLIEVETDINVGLHSFTIVGLADKALSEAKERVNSALKNSAVKPPNRENRKIVVNLAPADIKKTGSHYDLAIAMGYLFATKQIKACDTAHTLFLGELSLEGKLRSVPGVLSIAQMARERGFTTMIVPKENAPEAALIEGVTVIPAETLTELIHHLEDRAKINSQTSTNLAHQLATTVDISEVKGQEAAKRALMIAAAGGHNILMSGPPGTGKTMLAQALLSILPPPRPADMISATRIYSAAGALAGRPYMNMRPFRSPHHSASSPAVIGGGTNPRPGEISLAHTGVLFLDELPEFRRDVLEALRQPLENGVVHVSRAKGSLVFPARFMLVAAMNPCPCGYNNDEQKQCSCSAFEVARYKKKVSGPLLDRIDVQIHVPRVQIDRLRAERADAATGETIRAQVRDARARQEARYAALGKSCNAELSSKECDAHIRLTLAADAMLKQMFTNQAVSGRSYYRMLKVSQTIADLEGSDTITDAHILEAFGYRLREES